MNICSPRFLVEKPVETVEKWCWKMLKTQGQKSFPQTFNRCWKLCWKFYSSNFDKKSLFHKVFNFSTNEFSTAKLKSWKVEKVFNKFSTIFQHVECWKLSPFFVYTWTRKKFSTVFNITFNIRSCCGFNIVFIRDIVNINQRRLSLPSALACDKPCPFIGQFF